MDITEQGVETQTKQPIKRNKKIVIAVTIFLGTLLAVYLGIGAYFISHYYFGSQVNSVAVFGKTVEEVKTLMGDELNKYTLTLKERNGKEELIEANEIGLRYNSEDEFQNFKDKQKPFKWVLAAFNKEDSKLTVGIAFDEKLLNETIDKLAGFDSSSVVEPKDPVIEYKDNAYVVIDEIAGNKIKKEVLLEHIKAALINQESTIDLEAIDCYEEPKYTSKSKEVIDAKDQLNKYVSSKITYTFGQNREALDGSVINKWLTIDENYKVTFDETQAKAYVDSLANTYNTVGKVRSFAGSSGKTVNVGSGDYGWSINKDKESEALIAAIREGKVLEKEPVYRQKALAYGSNDIGNTYIEIDMTKQHMWFYKNGSLVVNGAVVTGNVKAGNTTPKGIYRLKYKQKDAVLRGPDYASPVSYWMPFNGGIGVHDASWRSSFGGNIYKTNGSHGCVNTSYNVAKTIYENIEPGTPVVCY